MISDRKTYLPVLLLSQFVGCWVLLRRKVFAHEDSEALLVLFLYSLNFGSVFSISVIHSMEVWRYSGVQFLAALLAHLWALFWMCTVLERALLRHRVGAAVDRARG